MLLPLLFLCACAGPIQLADDTPRDAGARPTYLTVVVRRGDTVSEIAARYDVSIATLARMNALPNANEIFPGEQLRVPADSRATRRAVFREADAPHYAAWNAPGAATHAVSVHEEPLPAPAHDTRVATAMPKSVTVASLDEPKHLPQLDEDLKEAAAPAPPKPAVVASRDEPDSLPQSDEDSSEASAPAPSKPAAEHHERKVASNDIIASHGEFGWPIQGRIILPFGGGDDGVKNDGINIAAQMGEPIRAAAAGTVIYAGNELKGYGNLVLIRHDNGYTTAYAHAESLSVSRGDSVKRGQTIGYAGATGDVRTPQVHFEIRQGVKPVDPKPLLLASRDS
ncbi:MAG TPA: M23 family metallopeptidase [Rhizomicrobium sp.]|jgi:murein DD-endopeptidase MepM/ murein hydrolase activator NlpD